MSPLRSHHIRRLFEVDAGLGRVLLTDRKAHGQVAVLDDDLLPRLTVDVLEELSAERVEIAARTIVDGQVEVPRQWIRLHGLCRRRYRLLWQPGT